MTKIDLITGFLGSGKTTFLKQYVHYLLDQGEKICLLEFDYGAINVDMMLLQEFDSLCDLEMVSGGCDYDCHLRRFKTKLIAMGMKKYDRVIVEPSGIFDPDEFFDTLYEDPLDQWYEINSVISIVDSGLSHALSDESRYILMAQLAASGKIILSKTQLHTPLEIEDTVAYLKATLESFHVPLDESLIVKKDFKDFTAQDYASIQACGYKTYPHEKENIIEMNSYQSVYFLSPKLTLDQIKEKAEILFADPSYGKVLRIKGFIQRERGWLEFNMTRNELSTNPLSQGQDVLLVIGENLQEEKIRSLIS